MPLARAAEAAGRVPARILLALLKIYQVALSPFFAGSCRFLPSCSQYAVKAVESHGAVRGAWLSVRRLARCHPLCPGGHDPVPAPGRPRV